MATVGEHPVPAGPLAVRWLGYELPSRCGPATLGRARVELENAGTAPLARRIALVPLARRPRQPDRLGRARGRRCRTPWRPASAIELRARVRGADPAGALPARARPRRRGPLLVRRARQRRARAGASTSSRGSRATLGGVVHGGRDAATAAALAAQEEPLVPRRGGGGRAPRRRRDRRRRTGRAACSTRTRKAAPPSAGSIEVAARRRASSTPCGSRRRAQPRVRASARSARRSLHGLEPWHGGAPACRRGARGREPWLFDGRSRSELRPRSGRRRA